MPRKPEAFPWCPINVEKLLSSTKYNSLSGDQQGIYLRILMHEWKQKGKGVPSDRADLAELLKLTEERMGDLERVLEKCFKLKAGRYFNETMEREIRRVKALSRKRKKAGEESGKARRKKGNTCSTSVPDVFEQTGSKGGASVREPEPDSEPEEESGKKTRPETRALDLASPPREGGEPSGSGLVADASKQCGETGDARGDKRGAGGGTNGGSRGVEILTPQKALKIAREEKAGGVASMFSAIATCFDVQSAKNPGGCFRHRAREGRLGNYGREAEEKAREWLKENAMN